MNKKDIDLIRDAAISLEESDINRAFQLMSIAYKKRPTGGLIRKKLLEYNSLLENRRDIEKELQLQELVDKGEIAIIPIGLRCYTARMIKNRLGVSQNSLPFNSGFFSPHSVASVLEKPEIEMDLEGFGKNHLVCTKNENYFDEVHGLGINFESSTYEKINEIVENGVDPNSPIRYLDSTFAYFTLDMKHNFVLAHYNWHHLSDPVKSNGITDPRLNLININNLFNRRIKRMMASIEKAKHVFFVFGENQNYKYIKIDRSYYDLTDFQSLESICEKKYSGKFTIVKNIYKSKYNVRHLFARLEECKLI